MKNEEKYKLNTKWVLWCHSLTNNNWDCDSYNKIFEIDNLYNYYSFYKNININNYFDSMFFLMRDNILPIWEDEKNKDGCSLTFKVPANEVKTEWDKIILDCITENIHKNIDNYDNLNGLSITPKKEFNIIKLWFKNNIKLTDIDNTIKLSEPYLVKKNIKIKKHIY